MKKQNTFSKLSKRETQILQLILEGKRVVAIAEELELKTNTISTFKKNIYHKLSVLSSIDLYKLAIKEGLVTV